MRWSSALIPTLKETPADAVAPSHILLMRAGMIRQLGAGAYTYLPLGLRVLRKAEAIIREEMDAAGGLELLMPALQPIELWKESGRFETFGDLLMKLDISGGHRMALGPTPSRTTWRNSCRPEVRPTARPGWRWATTSSSTADSSPARILSTPAASRRLTSTTGRSRCMARIETERLLSRDHAPGDLIPCCEMESDPEYRHPKVVHPRAELERSFREAWLPKKAMGLMATVYKPDGRYNSRCGLYPSRAEDGEIIPGEAQVAYYLARPYWWRAGRPRLRRLRLQRAGPPEDRGRDE